MTDAQDDKEKLADTTAPLATLYRATVSFGTTEAQLIWQRYTAFTVLNGFFVTAFLSKSQSRDAFAYLVIGILGLFANTTWHALNFSGWRNQNLWYRLASNLPRLPQKGGLATDFFHDGWKLPCGWIYWLAQSIPMLFSISAAVCFGLGVSRSGFGHCTASYLGVGAWLTFAIAVVLIEYVGIARWKQDVAV